MVCRYQIRGVSCGMDARDLREHDKHCSLWGFNLHDTLKDGKKGKTAHFPRATAMLEGRIPVEKYCKWPGCYQRGSGPKQRNCLSRDLPQLTTDGLNWPSDGESGLASQERCSPVERWEADAAN